MMTYDGGPAFPIPSLHHNGEPLTEGASGMSLRDYFAGQVLLAICSDSTNSESYRSRPEELPPMTAKAAYRMADAMLEARK